MEALSKSWAEYWGSRKKVKDISFPENKIVSPAYPRRVGRISHATFVNLHPTLFAVAVSPDGRMINLKGGYNMLSPGYYNIYYVDKRDRVNQIPRTEETTLDGFKVAMELVVSYRVINPFKALEVQTPVDTLLLFIQANLKEFMRSHKYEQIVGDLEGRKIENEQVALYIKEYHIDRSPLAKLFYIADVVVKERTGDPKVIELREKFRISMNELGNLSALQSMNQELERKNADQAGLIGQIKAQSEVARWNTLYETKLQQRELSNRLGVSPVARTDVSAPNDLLRIKVPLPELITSRDYFSSLDDQLNAVEYIYSVFAIAGSGDAKTVGNLIESYKSEKEVSGNLLSQLLANVNTEPLRIASIHYGSPAIFDLLGLGKILEILREFIKDIVWRNKDEKINAELDRRIKQSDIQRKRLEAENLVVSQRLENEKSTLGLENLRTELKKNNLELIIKAFEALDKFSQLNLVLQRDFILQRDFGYYYETLRL
jgi:hypothetical protein